VIDAIVPLAPLRAPPDRAAIAFRAMHTHARIAHHIRRFNG